MRNNDTGFCIRPLGWQSDPFESHLESGDKTFLARFFHELPAFHACDMLLLPAGEL